MSALESYKYSFLNFSTEKIKYMSLYKLTVKTISNTKISYNCISPNRDTGRRFGGQIYFKLDLYSKEELDLVDELFNNLDEGNLGIIKAILHSKTQSKNDNKT